MAGARARGVSIPGLPGVLIGASDDVAWGATVSNADQSDWVVVEVDPADRESLSDTRRLRGVHDERGRDRRRGRRARAHRDARDALGPGGRPRTGSAGRSRCTRRGSSRRGSTSTSWDSPAATDAASASALLARWAGPSLNWVLADRDGDDRLGRQRPAAAPRRLRRLAYPSRWPTAAARGKAGMPPPGALGGRDGVLFTANSRTLPIERADAVSRMWMRPLRAKRIDDLLAAQRTFAERDFLAMQLDTRAEGYEQIRAVDSRSRRRRRARPELAHARELARDWNGHADVEQTAFRMLHAYYRTLLERSARAAARAGHRGRSDFRLPLAARRRSVAAAARRAARALC